MDAKINPALPSINQLFKDSWYTLTQSILPLFLLNILGIVIYIVLGIIAVLIFIISGAGSFLLKNGLEGLPYAITNISPSSIITSVMMAIIFGIIFAIIGSALQIASVFVVDSAGKSKLGESFKKSLGLVIPLFMVSIITFFLTFGALFVLILPAILFYFLLTFTQFEIILNNQRGFGAMKRSVYLISRHFGAIFIRSLILVLIYLGISILINLLSKIGPDTAAIAGFASFIITSLFGWFALSYYLTLYKQVRSATDGNKKAGMGWMWGISLLGWLIAIALGFASWKVISSGILNQVFTKPPANTIDFQSSTY